MDIWAYELNFNKVLKCVLVCVSAEWIWDFIYVFVWLRVVLLFDMADFF